MSEAKDELQALAAWLRTEIMGDLAIASRNEGGHGLTDDSGYPDYRTCVDDDTVAADAYLQRFRPSWTRAVSEAHLAILDEHEEGESTQLRHGHWEGHGSNEHWIREEPNECPTCQQPEPCRTVTLLASGYRHRDGYPEETT